MVQQSLNRIRGRLRRRIRNLSIVEASSVRLKRDTWLRLEPIDLEVEISRDAIIIDGGANIGDISSKFARTGARVIAFEPNPVCVDILRRRFSRVKNVEIHPYALLDHSCTLPLRFPEPHSVYDRLDTTVAGSLYVDRNDEDLRHQVVNVDCIDLVDFVSNLGENVRLLKLDVEGAEVPILNALLDTSVIDLVDFVIVETHERFSEELAIETAALRERIVAQGLTHKIRLDWI